MNRAKKVLALLVLLTIGFTRPSPAQAMQGEWAWRPLLEHEGVAFTYIFYQEADGVNNGLVLMLQNENEVPVEVSFKIVLRPAAGEAHVEAVRKLLKPGQAKTGGTDGLFWIPWRDGRSIAEVGLRGYKVKRLDAIVTKPGM